MTYKKRKNVLIFQKHADNAAHETADENELTPVATTYPPRSTESDTSGAAEANTSSFGFGKSLR